MIGTSRPAPHDEQMSTSKADELRVLRERAYGPEADIHSDAAAVRRLRQLEEREVSPEPESVAEADEVGREQIPADDAAEAGTPSVAGRFRGGARRWVPVLWVGSVLVATLASVAVSAVAIQGSHTDPLQVGATQEAVLRVDDGAELPAFVAGQSPDGQRFTDYKGLAVMVTSTPLFQRATGDSCLMVMRSADAAASTASSLDGPMFVGCAANAFPAETAFRVDSESPEELRQAFPAGTALQFVFDEAGQDVVVFRSATAD